MEKIAVPISFTIVIKIEKGNGAVVRSVEGSKESCS
jgi:hypothetical protein